MTKRSEPQSEHKICKKSRCEPPKLKKKYDRLEDKIATVLHSIFFPLFDGVLSYYRLIFFDRKYILSDSDHYSFKTCFDKIFSSLQKKDVYTRELKSALSPFTNCSMFSRLYYRTNYCQNSDADNWKENVTDDEYDELLDTYANSINNLIQLTKKKMLKDSDANNWKENMTNDKYKKSLNSSCEKQMLKDNLSL